MRVPWRDRQGRFLPFKAAVLATAPIPGLVYLAWWIDGDLGGRALNEVIHATGNWAVRWLLLSLAITPFARIVEWPRLLTVRRMVGLTALAYATIHLSLYIADQKFKLLTVVSEIALRFYLTIGFVTLLGLIALGATSTDGAMKRMGKRWKQLHRLVYPIGGLALLHFYIQTKANVAEPVLVSGLFAWLMSWRLLPMARRTALSTFYALVPVSAALTMALEFAWYGIATRVDPFRILTANWTANFFPRPAHEVAAVALAIAIGVTARRLLSRRPTARVSAAGTNSR
ncbi:MAG: sulfoxide reductase heme-binding subunit YedZ [Acetobacteraceae bacterium]|nr:sulfoxide reductase heme-binding subunit YedZ [Acetobacteraceae bacterium]